MSNVLAVTATFTNEAEAELFDDFFTSNCNVTVEELGGTPAGTLSYTVHGDDSVEAYLELAQDFAAMYRHWKLLP